MSKGDNTKRKILNSAVRVAARSGIDGVSMDAVAEASGMSKGGVMYHFPSKGALLAQICAAAMDQFEHRVDELAKRQRSPYPWIYAFVKASFDSAEKASNDQGFNRVLASLIQSDTLTPLVAERYEVWQERLDREAPTPTLARLARHVSDGAWLSDAFDIAPMSQKQKRGVQDFLFNALKEAAKS